MINVWEANIKQKQTLIPVIPVIFYHGKQKWKSRKFSDYFKGIDQNIELFLPSFNYLLTDLSSLSEIEIRDLYKAMTVQISLLLMKSIFDEERFEKNIFRFFTGIDLFAETERGEKFLTSTMMYMYYSTEIEPDIISKILTEVSTKGGEIAMTTAMKLRQKGIQEGIQEGMQKGKNEKAIEIAKKMLPKMSIKDISELTGLPKEEIIEIKRSMRLEQKKTDLED
jgi:predicted transposase/invertase (TIGR01784 family)